MDRCTREYIVESWCSSACARHKVWFLYHSSMGRHATWYVPPGWTIPYTQRTLGTSRPYCLCWCCRASSLCSTSSRPTPPAEMPAGYTPPSSQFCHVAGSTPKSSQPDESILYSMCFNEFMRIDDTDVDCYGDCDIDELEFTLVFVILTPCKSLRFVGQ